MMDAVGYDTTRFWQFPIELSWEETARYVIGQWVAAGAVVRRASGEVEEDRSVAAGTLDELFDKVGAVRELLMNLSVHVNLSAYGPAVASLRPEHLKNATAYLYVRLPEDPDDPQIVRMHMGVEAATPVLAEGLAHLLREPVDDWLRAKVPKPSPTAGAPVPDTETEPGTLGAEQGVEKILADPGYQPTLPPAARATLAAIIGAVGGMAVMSVAAHGWEEGPSQPLSGLFTALVVAVIVYRFGLNK